MRIVLLLSLFALNGCDLGDSLGDSVNSSSGPIGNQNTTLPAVVATAVPVKSLGEAHVIKRGPYFGLTATVLEKRDAEWFVRLSEVTEGWIPVDQLVEIK